MNMQNDYNRFKKIVKKIHGKSFKKRPITNLENVRT